MRYDITIVGGGPAGYTTTGRAAVGGLKTVLFEKKAIGGVCLNKRCIPTKTLLYSTRLWDTMKDAARYGITVPDAPALDMGKIVDHKDKVVKKLAGDMKMMVGSYRVVIMEKEAVIVDRENGMFRIVAGNETYGATYLLVYTGSDTIIPSIPGLSGTDYWASKETLESEELPRLLVIIDGGIIGMELASFFNSMGAKVSVVETMSEILGAMDRETAGMLCSEYLKRGVSFYLGAKVAAVSHKGVIVEEDGKASLIKAGEILVSVGRKTDLSQAELDKLNAELLRNNVKVDEHMQASHSCVCACGDITGRSMLAHTAIRENEMAVSHILGVEDAMNYGCIPGVVYTNPEVAGAGRTEEELKTLGTDYHIQKLPMAYSGHFVAESELGNGLRKLVLDDGDRIIGCHLLGNPAPEIIMAAGIAVQHGYTVEKFQKSVSPHPTVEEILHGTLFA